MRASQREIGPLQSAGRPPNAWIITFNAASDEPRVTRQARTLTEAGWRVIVCGHEGNAPRPAAWTFFPLGAWAPPQGLDARRRAWMSRLGNRLARKDPADPLMTEISAKFCFHCLANWDAHYKAILTAAAAHPELRPDLVIAHDNHTCPPADALARRYGARIIVDSHEYMLDALPEDPHWLEHQRPFIKVMQEHYFPRVDQIITVSKGIADQLNIDYRLKRPVRVVRSLPPYQEQPFRPVGGQVTVLYHGIVQKVRDLDVAVEAAALWRNNIRLVIRGPGDPDYASHLRQLAAERGVSDRVAVEPPAPFPKLVARANEADIGYFVYGDGSPQRRYVLPNKFFEYTMAGLALCVSDLPEMSVLLKRYGLGVIAPNLNPKDIAAMIDSLAPAQIEQYKRASLLAAKTLCWENEQSAFLDAIHELYRPVEQ